MTHLAQPEGYDFVALYAAARLVATGRGGEVTDAAALLEVEHAAIPARTVLLNNPNPPALALVLAPLGLLPYEAAYLAMLALDATALFLAARWLAPLAAPEARARLAPFAVAGLPSLVALAQGQTTPLVLCAVAASLHASGVRAGLLLGATALRPQLLPLFALAALGERRRALGFALAVLATVVVSIAVAGPAGALRYPERVAYAAAETGGNEVSLPGVLRRMQGVDAGTAIGYAGAALVAGAVVVLRRRDRIAAAGPPALLAAPHALLHDLVFAYPAVAAAARGRRAAWAWALAGTAATLLQLAGVPAATLWLLVLAARTPSEAPRAAERGP